MDFKVECRKCIEALRAKKRLRRIWSAVAWSREERWLNIWKGFNLKRLKTSWPHQSDFELLYQQTNGKALNTAFEEMILMSANR